MLVSSGVLPARNEHLERLAPWLEHLLHGKPAHHTRLIRRFTHWFVLRRARRTAARRTFTRGSADFARARILVALDLLSWLDQHGQDLRDLTQADLDRWLTDGTTTRRAVRYFLQWAHGRGLVGDLNVPLPPRQEPERLLAERDHIRRLDRCLSQATWLAIDGHRLMLPARLAHLVRQLLDRTSSGGHSVAWEPRCRGSSLARVQHARLWTSSSASGSASTASTRMPGATPPALPWPQNFPPRPWLT